MPKNPEAPKISTEQLVEALWARNRELLTLTAGIEELKAALIARGAGKHTGEDPEHALTVVAAGEPGVKFTALDEDAGKAARTICGDEFYTLFEKEVKYAPQSGFADRMDSVLDAVAKRKLLALVSKPTPARAAYILGLPKAA